MKKKFYLASLGLISLLATSCANEELPPLPEDGVTTFSITLPADMSSRAFNSGTKATNLYVAVYEADGAKRCLFSNFGGAGDAASNGMEVNNFNGSLTTTVKVSLVKDKAYDIICWAQSYEMGDGSPYSWNETDKSISVSYADMGNYEEERDAFFGRKTGFISGVTTDHEIVLKRPFAQINLGTNDVQAYKYASGDQNPAFGMTITGASTTVNLADGTLSGEADPVTVALAAADTETGFPVTMTPALDYLAMGYVLPGAGLLTVDLNTNGKTKFATYNSVPSQTNFCTNIYGSLLTNPEQFNVTISPAFGGGWNNSAAIVSTPEEFKTAVAAGEPIYVAAGTTVDLSSMEPAQFDKPVTWVVDGTLTNIPAMLQFNDGLNLTGKGVLEFDLSASDYVGIETGQTSTYNKYGNVVLEGVTIRSINKPKDIQGSPLVVIRNPESASIRDITVEAIGYSGFQLDGDGDFEVTGCKFVSKYYDDTYQEGTFLTALIPYGDGTFTFNDCEIIGPLGILSAAGNAGGGNSTLSYNMVFNGGALISTEKECNLQEGPVGIGAMFGNGDVTFNGTYIYAASGNLVNMCAFFKTRNLTFHNCFVNDGQIVDDDASGSIFAPVSDGYTYTDITPVTKTINGISYIFTKQLSGTHAFPFHSI
ncbi:MAG: hypothetical protein J6C59_07720 [Muribaculaceae bacterium]|nr:hypothetical protein [Muribaculaceae bacterium]